MSGPMVDTPVVMRWAIKRDLPDILRIENECYEQPWSEEDFIRCLRQRNCICLAAEVADCVVGFVVYELQRSSLNVLNFAVRPDCQRRGIGSAIAKKLVSKLTERRNRITLHVRESNLAAQLFFRSQGFVAIGIERDYYDTHWAEDAYRFQYRMQCKGV